MEDCRIFEIGTRVVMCPSKRWQGVGSISRLHDNGTTCAVKWDSGRLDRSLLLSDLIVKKAGGTGFSPSSSPKVLRAGSQSGADKEQEQPSQSHAYDEMNGGEENPSEEMSRWQDDDADSEERKGGSGGGGGDVKTKDQQVQTDSFLAGAPTRPWTVSRAQQTDEFEDEKAILKSRGGKDASAGGRNASGLGLTLLLLSTVALVSLCKAKNFSLL